MKIPRPRITYNLYNNIFIILELKSMDASLKSFLITLRVPQGGHLSPFIFTLFINGIQKKLSRIVISSPLLIILRFFAKLILLDYCFSLPIELNNLVIWLNSIGLHLNVNKCQPKSFFRDRNYIVHTNNIKDIVLISNILLVKET